MKNNYLIRKILTRLRLKRCRNFGRLPKKAGLVMNKNTIQTAPSFKANGQQAMCFMFYNFENRIGTEWLEVAESLFQKFGYEPSFAIGNLKKKHSVGSYKKIRKRLLDFLSEDKKSEAMDMQIDSIHDLPEDGFFPCHMRLIWENRQKDMKQGQVALRITNNDNLCVFVNVVAPIIFNKLGKAYASAFIFPAIYGPDAYLLGVSSILEVGTSNDNPEYSSRLRHWRRNTWGGDKRPSQGFFREIYPINFLLQAHLDSAQ